MDGSGVDEGEAVGSEAVGSQPVAGQDRGGVDGRDPVPERPIAQPIDGWSNWVTFHDICRRCGRRITGFVCDSGRMDRIEGERWSVAMRWQHDGEGDVECDPVAAGRAVRDRSVTTPE